MTYDEFVAAKGITMTCKQIADRPGREDWPGATHWRCQLKRGGQKMQVTYSMGSAHKGTPKVEDVIQSLGSDASIYQNASSYEDFLDEFGYEDDQKHRYTWMAIQRESKSLRKLLGDEDYEQLLYETEEE